MKLFYIADGIIQGILTVICAVDIFHLFGFPGFSFPPYLVFILIGWQFLSGIITAVLWGKARYNKVLKVPHILLLCDVALLALLIRADKWLDIRQGFLAPFAAISTFLLLPGLIITITVLTVQRSIIAPGRKAASPQL